MGNSDSIRCFVAIEIPMKIQNLILEIQGRLHNKLPKATWTKPGNHHLTLKFLGNVKQHQITRIKDVLSVVASKSEQFKTEIGGLGVFPNWERPRVLWIGLKQGNQKIRTLSASINKGMEVLHYPIDTRFHPHFTLARFKKQVNIQNSSDSFSQYETLANSDFLINEFTLVKSELHPNGAVYTPINTFKLY